MASSEPRTGPAPSTPADPPAGSDGPAGAARAATAARTAESALRRLTKAGLRAVAGHESSLEQRLRQRAPQRAQAKRGDGWTQVATARSVVVTAEGAHAQAPRTGVHLVGGCDQPALFRMAPMLAPHVRGTLAIHRAESVVFQSGADILAQAAAGRGPLDVPAIAERLAGVPGLAPPPLFAPTFDVDVPGQEPFPVDVVFLTAGGNAMRPVYRHRDSGALLDPGVLWPEGTPLVDKATVAWVREEFEPIGVQSIDELAASFRTVVHAVRERTGAQLVVLDSLTVEPGVATHSYANHRRPQAIRRRELHLVLTELSAELGFSLLDVDRALKRAGIDQVVDFAHFPVQRYDAIAAEGARVLTELGFP